MRDTGVVRKIDELGRITLPMEIRKTLFITERDPLQIFVEDDRIILQKYSAGDIFTGEMDDLIEFHGRKISRQSIIEMAELAGLKVDQKKK